MASKGRKKTSILLFLCVLLLSINSFAQELGCAVQLRDTGKSMDAVMEDCTSVGAFSLGGLYNGNWEKLTYFYPKPWRGTFITVKVDDKLYTNSIDPREGVLMDQYLVQRPSASGSKLSVSWMLPEGVYVEESLELIDNSTLIHVKIKNSREGASYSVGARLHLDTMLGDNDGAPIYIPGDGLLESEKEYSGSSLGFKYWKAYNRLEAASIIATGVLDSKLTYPDKVVVADWKKSSKTAWAYQATPGTSILGDSALILYYDQKPLAYGETREIMTGYGSGEPVLKEITEVTEIVLNKISGEYCMGEDVVIKVDAGSRIDFSGSLALGITDKSGQIVQKDAIPKISIPSESVKSFEFSFIVPDDVKSEDYAVSAELYSAGGDLIDERTAGFSVDAAKCGITEEGQRGIDWSLLLLLFLVLVAIIAFIASRRRGEVIVRKVKEGSKVVLSAYNNSEQTLEKGVFLDRIPEGAEVDIMTLSVKRKGTKLSLEVGTLRPGEKATLEYRIKNVNVVPKGVFKWEGGEKSSA